MDKPVLTRSMVPELASIYLTLKCQKKIKKGAAYIHIIEVFNGAVVGEDIYCSCYQGCHGSKTGWDDFVGVRFLQFHCD